MAGDIDEVSRLLGYLENEAAESKAARDKIRKDLHDLRSITAQQHEALSHALAAQSSAINTLTATVKALNSTVVGIQTMVGGHEAIKQRGIGAIAAVSVLAGGSSGVIVQKLMDAIFGQ